jgi:hypothetical protein
LSWLYGSHKAFVKSGIATMEAPEVRALYEKSAAEQYKRPFDMAFSDCFKCRNLLSGKNNE